MDGLDALSNLASKMTPLDTPEKKKNMTISEGGNVNNNNNPEGEGAQPPIAMNNSGTAAALGSIADNNPPRAAAAAVNNMPLRKRLLQNMNLTSFDADVVEVATSAPHPNPTSVDDTDNASQLREEILQELKRRRSSLLGAVPPAAAPTIQELEMRRRASLLGDAAGGTRRTPTFMNDLYNEVARRNILTGGSSNDSLLSGIGGRTTTSIADLIGTPSLGNYGASSSALGMGGIIPPAATSMQYGSQNHHQQLQQLLQDNRGQGSSLPNIGNPMFAAGLSTLPPQLISTTSELQAHLLHAREEEARSALAQQRIQMELYLRQVEEIRYATAQHDAMVHGQQQQQTLMQDRRYQDLMLTNNPPGISPLGGRYAPSLPPHQAAALSGGEYQQALKLPSKSRGKKRSTPASKVTASTASASGSSKNPTADDKGVGKLSLPSDPKFLSEAYCFLRSTCVEVFIATAQDVANASHNNGDAPTHVGQVGFRCVNCKNRTKYQQANQAVCFPTAREDIFESVRNFQQLHFNACLHISNPVKMTYRAIIKRSRGPKRSNKLVSAYYSQAASEMGLIESKSHGLEYRESLRRKENEPSDEMLRIIQLAKEEDEMLLSSGTESDSSTNSFCAYVPVPVSSVYYSTGGVGSDINDNNPLTHTYIRNEIDVENVKYGKFDSVCSENAKRIMAAAKKTSMPFVQPDDYEGISDYVYLLFHQLLPCKHTAATIKRRRLNAQQVQHLPGLCCKYCVEVDGINGMYYPITCDSLGDSSFSQTLMIHISTCANVPNDVKSALEELKALVKEYKTSVKRGSKKSFVEKVWRRMEEIGRKELEASLSALTATPSTTMEHPLVQQQLPSLSVAAQPPSSHPSSRSSFTQASSRPPNQP